LQEGGLDTVDANLELGLPVDVRDYGVAARILGDLGVGTARLMTNNPRKVAGLQAHGIDVTQLALEPAECEHNRDYLRTKAQRLGHTLGRHLELVAEG
jgi:GTP cyclohydrolase II